VDLRGYHAGPRQIALIVTHRRIGFYEKVFFFAMI
jgi:hypothetical protein